MTPECGSTLLATSSDTKGSGTVRLLRVQIGYFRNFVEPQAVEIVLRGYASVDR